MLQSTQEMVTSLLTTFFQEFMDHKFKGVFGEHWLKNELIPFIKAYVEARKKDNDLSYDKYKMFLSKGMENCTLQSIDISFACSILLYEDRYRNRLKFDEEMLRCLNRLREVRNSYSHDTDFDEIKKIYNSSKTLVYVRRIMDMTGHEAFSTVLKKNLEALKKRILSDASGEDEGNNIDGDNDGSDGSDSRDAANLGQKGSREEPSKKSLYHREYDRAEELFSHHKSSDAFDIHLELAKCGYKPSMTRVAEFYQFGLHGNKNFDAAIEWYDKAKALEDEGEKDPAIRLREFRKTQEEANQGNAISQLKLGLALEEGKDAVYDLEKAVEWYEKSLHQGRVIAKSRITELAEMDEPAAMYALAFCLETGASFNKDVEEALSYYKKLLEKDSKHHMALNRIFALANENNAEAQFILAKYYSAGVVVPQDYKECRKWYKKASDLGLGKAQNNLALMYYKGQGVEQNYKEALKWYETAGNQGIDVSEYMCGLMYYNGNGMDPAPEEAARWFEKAAKQGLSRAQFNLGVMYEFGIGVNSDHNTAFNWYEQAALKDNEQAKAALAAMSEYGYDIEKVLEKTRSWSIHAMGLKDFWGIRIDNRIRKREVIRISSDKQDAFTSEKEALLYGLKMVPDGSTVTIYCDSSLVEDAVKDRWYKSYESSLLPLTKQERNLFSVMKTKNVSIEKPKPEVKKLLMEKINSYKARVEKICVFE